jgi:hypothetical protein
VGSGSRQEISETLGGWAARGVWVEGGVNRLGKGDIEPTRCSVGKLEGALQSEGLAGACERKLIEVGGLYKPAAAEEHP